MTKLTKEQIDKLIGIVSTAKPDDLTCDDCMGKVAQFAELELEERELTEALQAIQRHLEQCVCCRVEYEALIDALRNIEPRD